MANIPNPHKINEITLEKNLTLYCPMGKDMYHACIHATIIPGDEIMDYCETDRFLKDMNKAPLIIEDAVNAVYQHIHEAIKPRWLEVSITAVSDAHMPVTVTKRSTDIYEDCCSGCEHAKEDSTNA